MHSRLQPLCYIPHPLSLSLSYTGFAGQACTHICVLQVLQAGIITVSQHALQAEDMHMAIIQAYLLLKYARTPIFCNIYTQVCTKRTLKSCLTQNSSKVGGAPAPLSALSQHADGLFISMTVPPVSALDAKLKTASGTIILTPCSSSPVHSTHSTSDFTCKMQMRPLPHIQLQHSPGWPGTSSHNTTPFSWHTSLHICIRPGQSARHEPASSACMHMKCCRISL